MCCFKIIFVYLLIGIIFIPYKRAMQRLFKSEQKALLTNYSPLSNCMFYNPLAITFNYSIQGWFLILVVFNTI